MNLPTELEVETTENPDGSMDITLLNVDEELQMALQTRGMNVLNSMLDLAEIFPDMSDVLISDLQAEVNSAADRISTLGIKIALYEGVTNACKREVLPNTQ